MNDGKIVELYLSRDESAIAETAAKYGAALRQTAYRVLRDAPSAEECENDAYLEAWNSIPPNDPSGYLFAYLGRIVRHIAIDRCRRSAAKKRSALFCELTAEMEECLPGSTGAESRLEEAELARCINAFLAEQGAEQRRVFVRRYWFFDGIPEICLRYGFTTAPIAVLFFLYYHRNNDLN